MSFGARQRTETTEPRVKVCGVTRIEDAQRAVELGAAMIGLNFYPPSPRALSIPQARALAEAARGRARVVGVFVDRPPAEVEEIDRAVGFDLLQFHGDEDPDYVGHFGARAIQVFRTDGDLAGVALDDYARAWGFLFDVHHPTLYGGSGVTWSYGALRALAEMPGGRDADGRRRPVLVAGGIDPSNAARAARESGAWGLDVCSGVEAAPGIKGAHLLARLFQEVRHHAAIPSPS
jgi:phosphoribosylanthranilate isomerase